MLICYTYNFKILQLQLLRPSRNTCTFSIFGGLKFFKFD